MKPNTRLLIRFTLPDGAMKGWGYDYPHYKTASQLHAAIVADFADFPEHTDLHLFYDTNDNQITSTSGIELADTATAWLTSLGAYYGN